MTRSSRRLFLLWVASLAQSAVAQPLELETKVLDARRRIVSYEIEFAYEVHAAPTSGGGGSGRSHSYLSVDRWRADSTRITGPMAGTRFVEVSTPKEYLQTSADDQPEKFRSSAVARRADEMSHIPQNAKLDLRWLGIYIVRSGALHAAVPTAILSNPARTETTVETVVLDGVECQLVRITMKKGQKVAYWISPSEQYAVKRAEIASTAGGRFWESRIEATGQVHQPSGIWFPTRCKYRQQIDGQLESEEVVDVRVISLNEKIPDETFTLAGMNLPVGLPVTDSRGVGDPLTMKWDGTQLVPRPDALPGSRELERAEVAQSTQRRAVWFGFSVLFAVVAALLVWRYRTATA